MLIRKPQDVIRVYKERREDHETLRKMFLSQDKFAIASLSAVVPEDYLEEVVSLVSEEAGIQLTIDQAREILDLFPYARASVAESGVDGDTDASGQALSAVAAFFLRSEWPMNGDHVDMKEWMKMLREEAGERGYSVLSE